VLYFPDDWTSECRDVDWLLQTAEQLDDLHGHLADEIQFLQKQVAELQVNLWTYNIRCRSTTIQLIVPCNRHRRWENTIIFLHELSENHIHAKSPTRSRCFYINDPYSLFVDYPASRTFNVCFKRVFNGIYYLSKLLERLVPTWTTWRLIHYAHFTSLRTDWTFWQRSPFCSFCSRSFLPLLIEVTSLPSSCSIYLSLSIPSIMTVFNKRRLKTDLFSPRYC